MQLQMHRGGVLRCARRIYTGVATSYRRIIAKEAVSARYARVTFAGGGRGVEDIMTPVVNVTETWYGEESSQAMCDT